MCDNNVSINVLPSRISVYLVSPQYLSWTMQKWKVRTWRISWSRSVSTIHISYYLCNGQKLVCKYSVANTYLHCWNLCSCFAVLPGTEPFTGLTEWLLLLSFIGLCFLYFFSRNSPVAISRWQSFKSQHTYFLCFEALGVGPAAQTCPHVLVWRVGRDYTQPWS